MDPNVHRNVLSQQISELEHALLDMGSRAETMVGRAVDALVRADHDMAMEVVRFDDEIDLLDLEIEERCVRLLALQSPIASDLRMIGTALKMITDIERVGDLAVDIAKAGMKVEKELGDVSYIDFPQIAGVARSMLRDALQAFVKRDLELVAAVITRDDEVDSLYRIQRGQIHDRMRRSPEDVVAASWLLLALHHIERIADHAVNIAERVNFMVTGKFQQLAPSHGPDSAS